MAISKKYFFGSKCCRYCEHPQQIENYELAIQDSEKTWLCHHKLEAFFTKQELIDMGRYFNVPARELIFVRTQKDHMNLPHCGLERKSSSELISKKTKEAMSKLDKSIFVKSGKEAGKRTRKIADAYKKYKALGGVVSWNEFQKGVR